MSTPGQGSILGSPIIYGNVDYGPTIGKVYRPLNQRRVVVAAGNDIVQPYDQMIVYKKTVPAAFSVILPDLNLWMTQPYGGFDLTFKDGAGNASTFPISFVPFSTQAIDGQTSGSLPGGVYTLQADHGSLIFVPLVDMSGWQLL